MMDIMEVLRTRKMKAFVFVSIVVFIFGMVMLSPDYTSVGKFEGDMHTKDVYGKTVSFTVTDIERDNPMLGDVIYVSDNVTFVGAQTDLNIGDTFKATVVDSRNVFGVWLVNYTEVK